MSVTGRAGIITDAPAIRIAVMEHFAPRLTAQVSATGRAGIITDAPAIRIAVMEHFAPGLTAQVGVLWVHDD